MSVNKRLQKYLYSIECTIPKMRYMWFYAIYFEGIFPCDNISLVMRQAFDSFFFLTFALSF